MVLNTLLYVILFFTCVSIIGLVLIQQGKGADAGAAFGSGGAGTVFGAAGSGNFLTKCTSVLAVVFFVVILAIMSISGRTSSSTGSIVDQINQSETPAVQNPEVPSIKVDEPKSTVPAIEAQEKSDTSPSGSSIENSNTDNKDVVVPSANENTSTEASSTNQSQ